jgi:periplasmic divalent cation tolerance protein
MEIMDALLIVTTADSESLARSIASALVEAGEAACVNIIPGVRSIYRWGGVVCDEWEFLLMIKTAADKWEAVRSRIRQLHSYQVPEVIALSINAGDLDYLNWLGEQVKSAKIE